MSVFQLANAGQVVKTEIELTQKAFQIAENAT